MDELLQQSCMISFMTINEVSYKVLKIAGIFGRDIRFVEDLLVEDI